MIQDSGNRREFDSGAVRDIQEGKGRCDLLPLDVIAEFMRDTQVLPWINMFIKENNTQYLWNALDLFQYKAFRMNDIVTTKQRIANTMLEVAKHFEEGAKKYGERNWEKGIPTHCYIDSALRHYFKWMRGDKDEPHDRAFCWNILCCIWTCHNIPELNDYGEEGGSGMIYCDTCEYYDDCEYADGINFCEDCKDYAKCTIRSVSCKAGHDIECNNGFEDKNDYCCEDEEEEGVGE